VRDPKILILEELHQPERKKLIPRMKPKKNAPSKGAIMDAFTSRPLTARNERATYSTHAVAHLTGQKERDAYAKEEREARI